MPSRTPDYRMPARTEVREPKRRNYQTANFFNHILYHYPFRIYDFMNLAPKAVNFSARVGL